MNQNSKKDPNTYDMLERQRKAMRTRLYRMIDELEGRPVDRRKYQPFPYGILEKAVELSLQALENRVRQLIEKIEKWAQKKREK